MTMTEFTVQTTTPQTPDNFMNKKKFSKMVERTVRNSGLNYMDSIVHMCDKNNMEVEDVKKYLTTSIIDCLESEAMSLNFLEKTNSLDV
jgi:hypothetical protein